MNPSVAVRTETDGSSRRQAGVDVRHRYCVYGMVVVSDAPLALPVYADGGLGQIELSSAPASLFRTAMERVAFDPRSDSWNQYAFLPDGSTYVRWDGVGEFLVAPDGRRIACRRDQESSFESFQVYMLGQALSFALLKQRFEPLHATAVVVDDEAVVFLGNNGFGKSTLAACFLEAGHRLLTDDLLILQQSSGGILAYPGPPRIKLFPEIAYRFIGHASGRVPMNWGTDKLILPIAERLTCTAPVPLKAIYSLAPPDEACPTPSASLDTLSPREAFLELVKGTFNRRLVKPARLTRQFGVMASLADLVSVRKLRYPWELDRLRDVRAMVLADLNRG